MMYKLIISISLIFLFLSCSNEIKDEEDPCPKWQIQVQIGQKVRLIDAEGNWAENINYEHLELLPTDADYHPLYENFKQVPNSFEAVLVQKGNEKYIQLCLGRTYDMKAISENTCYFLLKVNDHSFHQIKTEYYTECKDFILTKFTYNGTEYTANDWDIVDVIVE